VSENGAKKYQNRCPPREELKCFLEGEHRDFQVREEKYQNKCPLAKIAGRITE
jgi:hypothetical protein